MKKILIIVGSIAALFVAFITAFCWYVLDSAETAANRNKTAAARSKRWEGKKEDPSVTDVDLENQNGQHTEEEQKNNAT
jgi:uncharacterized protein YpmB